MSIPEKPDATTKAYRRTGRAVVTVEREGRPPRRLRLSLQRYHALREWTAFCDHPWKHSGACIKSSMTAYLWSPPAMSDVTPIKGGPGNPYLSEALKAIEEPQTPRLATAEHD